MSGERKVPSVTAVMPTMARADRAASLLRAVDSILDQRDVDARVLAVVNGDAVDGALLQRLEAMPRVSVVRRREAGLPGAIAAGRRHCVGDYFLFLDDDDYLIADTLAERVDQLERRPECAVLVSNGIIESESEGEGGTLRRPISPDFVNARRDPLVALLERNWLASCGGLYRRTAVGTTYFDTLPDYYEWTNVAFRLALDGCRLLFDERAAFVVCTTAGSLSRSDAYVEAAPPMLRTLLDAELPPAAQGVLEDKLADAHHAVAEQCLRRGRRRAALRHHVLSLANGQGLRRYLSFTPRVVIGI